MPDLVIALDIGSSRVHAGIVDIGKHSCLFRSDFSLSEMSRRLPKALGKLKINVPAVIAGGRKGCAQKAGKILKSCGVTSIANIRIVPGLPLRFRYDKPGTLGADRIADALYAVTVYPKRNVIIIDSGTAITVDVVSSTAELNVPRCKTAGNPSILKEKELSRITHSLTPQQAAGNALAMGFMGGVILAGVGTQLCCLHAATNTLPMVATSGKKNPLPGSSTEQCMQAGAAHGTAGALNHLVRSYKHLLRGKCIVLATGGAWHLSKKLVDFEFIEAPDMTLIGTALYALYQEH